MIIELLETGGIYAYILKDEYLYIGKTKNDFYIRDAQHRATTEPTEFEKLLLYNKEIEMIILFNCKNCHLTIEQLDYLETKFINILKPKYNIQKIVDEYEKINIPNFNNNNITDLTNTESFIYQTLLQHKELQTFTLSQLKSIITITISNSTYRRAIKKLSELNKIKLKYTNNNGENVYDILI